MKQFEVFTKSPAASLLSSDGVTATAAAQKAVEAIKQAIKEKGMYVTFWSNSTASFTSIYSHTVKVPAKALKSLDAFQLWTIERINHFYNVDGVKVGILPKY